MRSFTMPLLLASLAVPAAAAETAGRPLTLPCAEPASSEGAPPVDSGIRRILPALPLEVGAEPANCRCQRREIVEAPEAVTTIKRGDCLH